MPDALPSLDGRRFKMTSSTASVVDAHSPSTFLYNERDGVIWGDYEGDTVTFGRFVGRRTGAELDVEFVHVLVSDGSVVAGDGRSTIEHRPEGLCLVEAFELHGVQHESVCVEIPAG